MSATPVNPFIANPEPIAFEDQDIPGYKIEEQDRPYLVAAFGFLIVVLLLVASQAWRIGLEGLYLFIPVYFMPNTNEIAVNILTSIAVVTTLMERAIEVLISGTRGMKRQFVTRYLAEIDKVIAERREAIKTLTAADEPVSPERLDTLRLQLEALEIRRGPVDHRLTSYRTGTRIRALSFSLFFGTLIAIAGVRAITPLLDVPYTSLSAFQWAALQIVDVASTAALIAGGTSGIHRIISGIGARIEPKEGNAVEKETRPF